jgi:hypothetical protein
MTRLAILDPASIALFVVPVACASASSGAGPSREAPPSEAPATRAAEAADQPGRDGGATSAQTAFDRVPTTCEAGQADGVCAPPKAFVQWLCGTYPRPDVALIVFGKGSPFTRVYLNRNVEGWYSSGQQSTSAKLMFDEEVIVLSHPQGKKGGMIIGQGGTPYDVLRLDGVCSTVEPELLSTKRPPNPKHANIQWQQLDKRVREALLQDAAVAKAESERRKECKGTTTLGVIGPACAKADDRLSAAIASYIVNGGSSPMPASP